MVLRDQHAASPGSGGSGDALGSVAGQSKGCEGEVREAAHASPILDPGSTRHPAAYYPAAAGCQPFHKAEFNLTCTSWNEFSEL